MKTLLTALALIALVIGISARAQAQPIEPRIAFVVGNGSYARGPLPTALNDAGLVAEALRSIGFEVVESADASQADLVRDFRTFLSKVEAAGPDTIAFVYFSGYAFSYDGDNLLVAADARLERDTDIPLDTVRLGDLLRPLAGARARARIVVLDAARPLPFPMQGVHIAHGLEAIDAAPGMLIGFSASPGTFGVEAQGPYGAYATAIAEMIRIEGLDVTSVFTRIRARTHQLTQGAQTPWDVSTLDPRLMLVPPEPGAPPPPPVRAPGPVISMGPDEAYAYAIEEDTLPAYIEFVEAFPQAPYAPRVWALIRARREALAWLRARELNTPESYWTYLRRYPDGIYAADCERRLHRLSAAFRPPPDFVPLEFAGVPLPLIGEPRRYYDVMPPAPPPPARLIGRPPPIFLNLPPPQRGAARTLPATAPLPGVHGFPPRGPGQGAGAPPAGGAPPGGVLPGRPLPPGAAVAPPAVGAPPGASAPSGTAPPSASAPPPGPGRGRVGPPGHLPPPSGGFPPPSAPARPPAGANVSVPPPGARPEFGRPPRGPGGSPPTGAPPPGGAPSATVPPPVRPVPPGPPQGAGPRPPAAPSAAVGAPPPPASPPPPRFGRGSAQPRPVSPGPPQIGRAPPPPAVVNAPKPPPPPVVNRPPPPPPPVARQAPPPQAAAPPRPSGGAPPPKPSGGAPPPGKKCVVENGVQVCR